MDERTTGRQTARAGDTGAHIQHFSTDQRENFLTAVEDIKAQAESLWPSDWQQILSLGFQRHDSRAYFDEKLPMSSKTSAQQTASA